MPRDEQALKAAVEQSAAVLTAAGLPMPVLQPASGLVLELTAA